ncbi:ATP-dependent DNA ligase [Flavilitoribacter nigricans]|uniref:DNA ligase (ATP) n=1 Tax=Flavilitoribacter nigricans (strain ATCC 23147 / DSM 23189 / NBRC 102662 / NCIMB 1420 / SS-2) TaxID=1122177 RepID=A0A2D0N6D8_FLAN2|nr:ATP-dependent DNA ligase [Flavilitoribacter nigricans]PHN04065.1 ATP-dependent DNA ligase [Flavilitoribacter nigricans DSM 23189 = NBRC 102662]
MKNFARLFRRLDQTNKTNAKVEALADYFQEVGDEDKLWTVALLSHRRPKRSVNTTLLRAWAAAYSGVPLWLFEESYHVVGDLAETISLVLPAEEEQSDYDLTYWINYVRDLKDLEEEEKKERVFAAWQQLNTSERFVFNKLITGSFRVGVSQKLMVRALSRQTGIDEMTLAHRLMGGWTPDDSTFEQLILTEDPLEDISRPYPFYLAYQLDDPVHELGKPSEWQAEYKWDGIRGQVIVREDELFVWSRGEELVTDKFPEYNPLADLLPNGTVIDGEILPFRDGKPLGFQILQTRIGRKNVTKKHLRDAPVVLMAYDLLEWQGKDIRQEPLAERRRLLEQMIQDIGPNEILLLSEAIAYDEWQTLAELRENAREQQSEGIMLKQLHSPYLAGRKRGDWWKWKVDPLTIDAVMIYAQRGHGRRANLYTDFTFAVWNGEDLVPFTKAYSGLTDAEFRQITAWVRKNTVERFGPVRSVNPKHVFEIAFEGIQRSNRHKSGVALRFPRMLRWRKDKPVEEANTLEDLHALLEVYEQG